MTFSQVVIAYGQELKPRSCFCRIEEEIERPDMVGIAGLQERRALAWPLALASFAGWDLQLLLPPEPLDALDIDLEAAPLQSVPGFAKAPASPPLGEQMQLLPNIRVCIRAWPVQEGGAMDLCEPAGVAQGEPAVEQVRRQLLLAGHASYFFVRYSRSASTS